MTQPDIIQTVLHDSSYRLALFRADEIAALDNRVFVKSIRGKETPFVECIVRGRDIQLKPEEVVRQLYAARLIKGYGYPKSRLAFEHPVNFGREKKKADIVIFEKGYPDSAYTIVEVKKPRLSDGKNQLRSYSLPAHLLECGPTASRFPTTTAKTPIILKTSATFPPLVRLLRTYSMSASP